LLELQFTIVVPVTHSLAELGECLESLAQLEYPKDRFQVALVDCHSVQGVREFCREQLPRFDLRVTLFVLPETVPYTHPHWLAEARTNEARNYAMHRAPARCYVFTEDDCTFEPEWLSKIDAALGDNVGAVGGPDLLPQGLGSFAGALDWVLNSRLGSGAMRRGDGNRAREYYPRKQNMAVPGEVFARLGVFPEDKPVTGEMEIAVRARQAGLRVVYLADNPVWHRRVAGLTTFFRLSAYMATGNVRLLRRNGTFRRSTYFLVFAAGLAAVLLGVLSLFSTAVLTAVLVLAAIYFLAIVASAFLAMLRRRSLAVGLGVLILMPAHHLSLVLGTLRGAMTPVS
jgi:GT2 family glycosyltransferase